MPESVVRYERLARASHPGEFCPIAELYGMRALQGPVTQVSFVPIVVLHGVKDLLGPVIKVSFVPVSCVARYDGLARTSHPGEFCSPTL